MDAADWETMAAFYCFVNLGWTPSQFLALPFREKLVIVEFIRRDSEARKKAESGWTHG